VIPVLNATIAVTVEKLLMCLPSMDFHIQYCLIMDQFLLYSSDFAKFVKQNGIEHILTPPYHPASNSLAERSVQTFKNGLKQITDSLLETRVN